MFEITEKFTSEQNLDIHYKKHVIREDDFGDITKEQYELLADLTQSKPVDNKNILGYISEKDGRLAYCKYDKSTGIFVVYYYKNNKPLTITCYIKSWRKYNADKAIEYYDEIPKGL